MIRPIPLNDRDEFYQNKEINNLVDLSLDNLDDNLFLMIINLIQQKNLKFVHKIIDKYKSRVNDSQIEIYENIKDSFDRIYNDERNKDNLRGAYLELLVYKFFEVKYSSNPSYIGALHCNVEIHGNSDYKTVDVFASCWDKGFISENKIGFSFFEDHDIENLNKIYVDSEYHLKPYIITLASQKFIDKKLNDILQEDHSNVWVQCSVIKVISANNIKSFFS